MFRGIKNVFIILLIGIVASGIPIYANNVDINAFIPDILSIGNTVTVTAERNIISSNHVQIRLGFSPKSKTNHFNFFFDESEPFTVELLYNNERISDLPPDELISSGNYESMEFYNNSTQYITFEFEQERLNLPDGSYNLRILPNIKDKKVEIADCEFNINFSTKGDYVEAVPSIKGNEMALTLHFPDNEFNHLVPITRIVGAYTYPPTEIVSNIEQGPDKDLGLPTGSPITIGSSAWMNDNTAYVRFPENIGEFDHGSVKATTAINSLVKSLTSLDGIEMVQFYLTGRQLNDPFHGIDIDNPFPSPKNTEICTAYITDTNRFLLAPIPFDMFDNQNDNNDIEAIFDAMKFKAKAVPDIYNAKRHPIVPDNIELLDYSIDDNILTLVFNEEFTGPHKNRPDCHKMMVDGIVFTFMSLENIDSVDIKIRPGSKKFDDKQLLNYDFTMPVYINPEK